MDRPEFDPECWVSTTRRIITGCGKFYVTIFFESDTLKPAGMTIKQGRGSSCHNTIMSCIDGMAGLMMQEKGLIATSHHFMNKECEYPTIYKGKKIYKSCLHAIYLFLEELREGYMNGKILDMLGR